MMGCFFSEVSAAGRRGRGEPSVVVFGEEASALRAPMVGRGALDDAGGGAKIGLGLMPSVPESERRGRPWAGRRCSAQRDGGTWCGLWPALLLLCSAV
ncbi:hypothetical protein Dimus_015908 [Dionaea muscipula]